MKSPLSSSLQLNPLFVGMKSISNQPMIFIQNKNSKIFPSDFFDPILPQEQNNNNLIKDKKTKDIKSVDHGTKQKSIYVNLQKEYDEDKELLELLSGKRKLNLLIFIKKYSLY